MSERDAEQRRIEELVGQGEYGPGFLDEITVPPTDEVREAKQRDLHDPADVAVDPDEWRDGGPTRSPGAATTTGHAPPPGPAAVRRPPNEHAAPTTTGSATSGGMGTPTGGSTSDNTTGATHAGDFTEE